MEKKIEPPGMLEVIAAVSVPITLISFIIAFLSYHEDYGKKRLIELGLIRVRSHERSKTHR